MILLWRNKVSFLQSSNILFAESLEYKLHVILNIKLLIREKKICKDDIFMHLSIIYLYKHSLNIIFNMCNLHQIKSNEIIVSITSRNNKIKYEINFTFLDIDFPISIQSLSFACLQPILKAKSPNFFCKWKTNSFSISSNKKKHKRKPD